MNQLSPMENIKIGVGVWMCFSDGKLDGVETSTVYKAMEKDLHEDAKEHAVMAVGQWATDFHKDFAGTQTKLEDLIKNQGNIADRHTDILDLF